uniref:Uncharacterized protein n=1 Tax=Anguilla anguilla TaxID=7936 RepID=A0A0E9W9N3_ANGAN
MVARSTPGDLSPGPVDSQGLLGSIITHLTDQLKQLINSPQLVSRI